MSAQRRRLVWTIRTAVAVIVLAGIVWVGSDPRLIGLEFHWFHRTVAQAGALAPLITVAVIALHAVLPYPVTPVIVLAVAAMGPVSGLVSSWTGLMMAAYLGFYLARWAGQPLLAKMVPAEVVDRFGPYVTALGPVGVFLARVLPVPFAPVSLLAGLSPVRPLAYGVATGLGILPGLAVVGLLVNRQGGVWEVWVTGGGFLVVLFLAWQAQRRLLRRSGPAAQEGAAGSPNLPPEE